MLKKVLIGFGVAAVAVLGFASTQYVTGGADNAGSAGLVATEGTATFTFTNVATATYPLPAPETVTVTETAPPPATTAPPTTSAPPVTTTQPPVTTAPPPPVNTANLWVDTNGGTCVRKATPAAYVDAEACTWGGAADKGLSGDLALVKGGSYGDRQLDAAGGVTRTTPMTIKTAPGETVITGAIENGFIGQFTGSNNITFVGPAESTEFRNDTASGITVDGWKVDCKNCFNVQIFHMENASNMLVKNSEIMNNTDNSLIWINGTGITFDNNEIHDAHLRAGSSAHTECMYSWAVTNLTLKRNHFYNCEVMDVFITGNDSANGGFVENNWFEKQTSSSNTFHFRNGTSPAPKANGWDFRYNTWGPGTNLSIVNGVGPNGLRVIGNDFQGSTLCSTAGGTFSYNKGCGGITTTLDKGNPSDFPAVDKNGATRPKGAAPDIGAYEVA